MIPLHATMERETDPQDTAGLRLLADSCKKKLHSLSEEEEARKQHGVTMTKDRFWVSRQLVEFNLWCHKVGVNGEGIRSLDARLKDVPNLCKLLGHLLQSLQSDLNGQHAYVSLPV